jgi:hypothetical protein
MNPLFKYMYAVAKYIELEYDEKIGKEIQNMVVSTIPVFINDLVSNHFRSKNNVPNAAGHIIKEIRKKYKQEEDDV